MKIQTETVDYAPVIPSHPWATADRDVYTSGDLVPKGYERTFQGRVHVRRPRAQGVRTHVRGHRLRTR